jgi:hypothetical protein
VIFGIMMTAVFATFSFQQKSYTTQNFVAEMQQNMRIASDILERDIRMAGYGLFTDLNVPGTAVGNAATTVALRGFYPGDGGTSAPDNIYVLYMYDIDNTVAARAPTLTTAQVSAVNAGTVTVSVTPGSGSRFAAGDLVVLNNGLTADMYEVTGLTANSITFGNGSLYNSTGHGAGNVYDTGSEVSFARFVMYYIDNTTTPTRPRLMMRMLPATAAQPVADDIEDMQFVYGLAVSVDNTLVNSTADSPSVSNLSLVRRINLSLVGRTRFPEVGWGGQRPNYGNRSGTAPADGYRRRVLNNVAVDVRNIRFN